MKYLYLLFAITLLSACSIFEDEETEDNIVVRLSDPFTIDLINCRIDTLQEADGSLVIFSYVNDQLQSIDVANPNGTIAEQYLFTYTNNLITAAQHSIDGARVEEWTIQYTPTIQGPNAGEPIPAIINRKEGNFEEEFRFEYVSKRVARRLDTYQKESPSDTFRLISKNFIFSRVGLNADAFSINFFDENGIFNGVIEKTDFRFDDFFNPFSGNVGYFLYSDDLNALLSKNNIDSVLNGNDSSLIRRYNYTYDNNDLPVNYRNEFTIDYLCE